MNHRTIEQLLLDDPRATARAAGLTYVEDDDPGYRRQRRGQGFSYLRGSNVLRGERLLKRFAQLAIPPAWEDVWIAFDPRAHIQATGRDEKGRKQYIYHSEWQVARDNSKYDRMVAFGYLLPRVRKRITRDLHGEGLERSRVLAAIVRLLETTLVRVGNREYARTNNSFGLTTLRKKHVDTSSNAAENESSKARGNLHVEFEFVGKGGKDWHVDIDDAEVTSVIAESLETPGYEVFKFVDGSGVTSALDSDDVNEYLREAAGAQVSAKDFRTWAGTVLAALALQEIEELSPDETTEKKMIRAVEKVAMELGNTTAVCRASYIHPEILQGFESGALLETLRRRARSKIARDLRGLSVEEAAVLVFLEKRLKEDLAE